MKKSELKVACVSDIHLGHPNNAASFIIDNLYKAFDDSATTAQLDILFIAGDVYDRLLNLQSEHVQAIDSWILYMLRLCKKHDIQLRVLKGTPRHDWDQPDRFVFLNEAARIHADLLYFNTLEIEYNDRYGIHVLYVPDEYNSKNQDTLEEVKQLLTAKGLSKVDFAIMHGCFSYQLPGLNPDKVHDDQAYLSLVKYLIFIGHVHTFSKHDRIVAQGSFDRDTHGQEEPKGHVRATCYASGAYELTFIENEGARKFVTINLNGDDLAQDLNALRQAIGTLPAHSFVRIKTKASNPILQASDQLIREFPDYTFTNPKIVDEQGKDKEAPDEQLLNSYQAIVIDKGNIKDLIAKELIKKNLAASVMKLADSVIEDIT